MAQPSTSTSKVTSTHSRSHPRPEFKRKHHTWHGPVTYRSHFEDFMLEIGEDPSLVHLCCVPRQAHRHVRTRANSEPKPMTVAQHSFLHAPSDTMANSGPTPPRGRGVRRQSAPAALATLATFSPKRLEPVPSKLIFDTHKDTSTKVRLPSKASATTSVDIQSRTPSCLYSIASVSQRLRTVMQVFDARDRSPLPSGQVPDANDDQGQWSPLPTSPALEPRKLTILSSSSHVLTATPSSAHTVSRAPSFASLDTASVSSSEGPSTPLHMNSPVLDDTLMSPTLSYLEHASRFRVPGVCVTCKRGGANFPSCAACGDTWCSRECRLVATDGRKHNCRDGTVEPSAGPDDEQVSVPVP